MDHKKISDEATKNTIDYMTLKSNPTKATKKNPEETPSVQKSSKV